MTNPVQLTINRGASFDLGTTPTVYTLIQGSIGVDPSGFVLPANAGGFIFTLRSEPSTALFLDAQYYAGAMYWKGTANDAKWSTLALAPQVLSNWATSTDGSGIVGTTPGIDNDLIFTATSSPSNAATSVIDADYAIRSLTILNPATTAITGTNSPTLTLGSGGLTLSSGSTFTLGSTTDAVNLAVPGSLSIVNANAVGAGGLLTIQNTIVATSSGSVITFTGSGDIAVNGTIGGSMS